MKIIKWIVNLFKELHQVIGLILHTYGYLAMTVTTLVIEKAQAIKPMYSHHLWHHDYSIYKLV